MDRRGGSERAERADLRGELGDRKGGDKGGGDRGGGDRGDGGDRRGGGEGRGAQGQQWGQGGRQEDWRMTSDTVLVTNVPKNVAEEQKVGAAPETVCNFMLLISCVKKKVS